MDTAPNQAPNQGEKTAILESLKSGQAVAWKPVLVALAIVVLVMSLVYARSYVWHATARIIFGGPMLKFGGYGDGRGGVNDIVCGNGTVFNEIVDSRGQKVLGTYYRGRLKPSDLKELKIKLGTSFTMDDVDSYATYTGGPGPTRNISYDDFVKYGLLIADYEERVIPAHSGKLVQDTAWVLPPMLPVSFVDCMPR
jgi:hypothetical protein